MFRTILIPTDFSECSRRALDLGFDLADKYHCRVLVLHASASIDHSSFVDEQVLESVGRVLDAESDRLEAAARAEMERLVEEMGHTVAADRVEYRVAFGSPATLVVDLATEIGADLIVMGTHGRKGIRDALMGSTAERVTRRAPCAVLTVKAEGYPFLKG